MLELMHKGGPIMWLLLLVSVAGTVVFLERWISLHRAQIKADDFLKGIYNILNRNNIVEAVSICEDTPGPVARIVKAAILHYDEEPGAIRHAVEDAGLVELPRLERNMGLLASMAKVAPLLGLLGTVLGMMKILLAIQQKAPLVHIGDLTVGLWEALISTAAGLALAILAHTGYNFLVARLESLVFDMERTCSDILAFLSTTHRRTRGG